MFVFLKKLLFKKANPLLPLPGHRTTVGLIYAAIEVGGDQEGLPKTFVPSPGGNGSLGSNLTMHKAAPSFYPVFFPDVFYN